MFPWNYGFHFGAGTYIFMGAFYTVLVVVATTLLNALWRSHRDLSKGKVEDIRWHSDFHDLSAADRTCRHVLTGEFPSRECPNAFDCRECETHAKLVAMHPLGAGRRSRSEIFGMSFPLDRMYHRGHTWARPEADGTVTVGLDDLGTRLLGTPDAVDLPEPGIARPRQRHGVPHPQARSRRPRALAGGWRSGRDRRRRSRLFPAREAARRRRSTCVTCCAAPK